MARRPDSAHQELHYYAGATRVAMREGSSLYYLLGDHLGSTSLVTDPGGVILSATRYDPWGELRAVSGPSQTSYGYTGQRAEKGLGLYFYGARWYDPQLSRFLSADSIIPQQQGVQAWDRYAYVNNNPLKYTDPSGHCILGCVGDAIVIGALAGGFISAGVSALIQYQETGSVNFEQAASAFVGGVVTGGIMAAAAPASLIGAFVVGGAANVAGNQAAAATTAILNPTGDGFWEDFASFDGLYNGSNITNVGETVTDFTIGGAFGVLAYGVNKAFFPSRNSRPAYYELKYQVDFINQASRWAMVGGGYPLANSGAWGAMGGVINAVGRRAVDGISEYCNQAYDKLEDLLTLEY